MSKVELLFLSEEDVVEAGVLNAKKCVDTIEEVFHSLILTNSKQKNSQIISRKNTTLKLLFQAH